MNYELRITNYFVSLQKIKPKNEKKMKLLLFGLGMQEIIVIALIVLLLFGGKKIPELMKGLGKGVKSFKDGMKEVDDEVKEIKEVKEMTDEEVRSEN